MLVPNHLLSRHGYAPVTRTRIASHLRQIGVVEGGVLMVHVRLSAFGWVVGGMDSVVHALRDAIGATGTLMALSGWEDSPYHVAGWPESWRQAYRDQPPFDPRISASRREFGRFPERLRTWPAAERSSHPEVSFVALGPRSSELLADPDDGDPWGPFGPLGGLVRLGGQVLMLGAPLKSLTLCHHAEATANVQGKRYRDYQMPVREGDEVVWASYRTLDTFYGALPYWDRDDLEMGDSIVAKLADQAVAAGATEVSRIEDCTVVLIDAAKAANAVRAWIEANFR
ncbi:AAC(3) family N-acetyltransferase [Catellatospora sp. NPDC049609]|uniref:aminoglycoside N(3)-acetyltransferase n=1 Tax=Catellatospora sp. NPDC049609 TaxID=3155505 RepID=UPI00342BC152